MSDRITRHRPSGDGPSRSDRVQLYHDAQILKWAGVSGSFTFVALVAIVASVPIAFLCMLGMLSVLIGCVGAERASEVRKQIGR